MKKIAILGTLISLPLVTNAVVSTTGLGGVLIDIANIITNLTPVVVALALLYFFWGLAKYILNAGDEEKKAEGRGIMIWGIISLFVIVSVWGIVGILNDTFTGGQPVTNVPIPGIDVGGGGSTR